MVLSATDAARAVALVQDGRSQYYAARVIGATRSSVQRAVQRFQETGGFVRRRGSGRKRCTNARDNRFLTLSVLRDRTTTAVQARSRLEEVRQVAVNEITVRRRLKEYGLRSRRPATGPDLTRAHRVTRLQFARDHQNWGNEEWKNILFSDESRYCLKSPDGRQRIYRRTGERFDEGNFATRLSYGGGSVMVWGGVSMEARTELILLEGGAMNADRYIREILESHVIPFAPFIGENFMLMHDNARPHVARVVSNYLDGVEISRINWPPRSSDLNPIEHVWDAIGRRLRARIPAPDNLNQLSEVLREEWEMIDQDYIRHLIEGMPRRIAAVIRARGGNTRY